MSLALLTSAPESTEGHVAQVEARLIPSPEWTKDGKVQGDVYLTPDRVVFYSSQAQRGLSLGYTHLGLHAVGRLEDGRMHVYCQLDGLIPTKESLEAEDQLAPGKRRHEETEGSVDEAMTELYLIPETDDQVELIFTTLSEHASRCPDPEGEGEEGEEEEDGSYGPTPCLAIPDADLEEGAKVARQYLNDIHDDQVQDPPSP